MLGYDRELLKKRIEDVEYTAKELIAKHFSEMSEDDMAYASNALRAFEELSRADILDKMLAAEKAKVKKLRAFLADIAGTLYDHDLHKEEDRLLVLLRETV